jgi:hypothetical protein
MATITQEEFTEQARKATEPLREVLLPLMKAGVDVSVERDPKDQFYLAKLTVPEQPDLHYEILIGIPIFEGQWCGRLPIERQIDVPGLETDHA